MSKIIKCLLCVGVVYVLSPVEDAKLNLSGMLGLSGSKPVAAPAGSTSHGAPSPLSQALPGLLGNKGSGTATDQSTTLAASALAAMTESLDWSKLVTIAGNGASELSGVASSVLNHLLEPQDTAVKAPSAAEQPHTKAETRHTSPRTH